MWRQGDVMIAAVPALPAEAAQVRSSVLAHGEATGHQHRIEDPATAEIFEKQRVRYLRVISEFARIIHEEHRPIVLRRGVYRFWHQREYTPSARDYFRPVCD